MNTKPILFVVFCLGILGAFVGCGGSDVPPDGSIAGGNVIAQPGPDAPNVVEVMVDKGVGTSPYINGVFVTLKVCIPGSTAADQCQTIDHVLVDTGSVGLRLLPNGANEGGELALSLPGISASSGMLAECMPFMSSATWGMIGEADLYIAGEVAKNLPFQFIGTDYAGAVPATCTGSPNNDISTLGANGILGVGPQTHDCGDGCAATSNNYGWYYTCSSSAGTITCGQVAVDLAYQVANPVGMFGTDKNGTILELPSLDWQGDWKATGSLVFGINTQPNNQLGNSLYIATDACAKFTTYYDQGIYPNSFIDSGSNATYFLDDTLVYTAGLQTCQLGSAYFYCTTSGSTMPVNLKANNAVKSGQNSLVSFGIADASALMSTGGYAFNDFGGPLVTSIACGSTIPGGPAFDWGLPFFFGRNVYTGLEDPNQPGTGIFFAYN